MSTIDERVVELKFDNAQFQRGIQSTLDSLSALNKGLRLDGAAKGLDHVSAAARSFSLASIASGVQDLTSKFGTMNIVGLTALTNIVNSAVNAGKQLVKSLTVDPIKSGLSEYETNLNSIQTVLANTAHEGTNLKQVNAALAELNTYSDKTIYNFSEMARNIGTFTAAGVSLKTSTAAIKGIANLAAVSGSNAEQASTAMYQLSQALAAGKVSLMDWNSVVNAGMGGKVFQDALMETARVHGVAIDDMVKKEGGFRNTLQKGWLSSEILTETLNKFTGDLSAKQLKAMGYTDAQIAGILKMGKTAQDAATKVKTVSQLIGTLQEAAGSGWTATWQILFGDFEEAKSLFTNVNNVLGGFISGSAEARNKVLGDWKALGGRTVLIEAIGNAFNAVIAIIKPVKQAFREIFPATTGKQLYNITVAIRNFTEYLKIGADTSLKVKQTFGGLFAVFGIAWEVIKQVADVFLQLFMTAGKGSGGILDFTARVGTFLIALHKTVQESNGFKMFFVKIADVLKVPIKLIREFVSVIADFVSGLGSINTKPIDNIAKRFAPFGKLGDIISGVWSRITTIFGAVLVAFAPLASKMSSFFSGLSDMIINGLQHINYNSVLDSINTGLLAGIALLFKKFLSGGLSFDVGGGFVSSLKESFGALTGTLQAMQTQIKANTIVKIAGAVALLTVSVVALSLVDSAKLAAALGAMSVMFVQLIASMAAFSKLSGGASFAKLPVIAAGLLILSGAVALLAVAVAKLAVLDWNGLVKGLTGVSVLIGALAVSTKLMSGSGKGMISAGIGLVLLASAIRVLVSAVESLAALNWNDLSKGLVGVATLLLALGIYSKFADADAGGVLAGAGLVLLATGIKILASAVTDIASLSWGQLAKGLTGMAIGLTLIAAALLVIPPSSLLSAAAVLVVATSLGMIGDAIGKMGAMKWSTIGKGITALAGALVLIAGALTLMPPSTLISAAAVFIVATALGTLADALAVMGGMSWSAIAKGLVELAGSLTIIALAMLAMTTALPGAAALLVVAGALRILTPVLQAFGAMSWGEMGKSLLFLAGTFAVLGVAGLALAPVIPALLGLGVAVALLGAGVALAGVGLLAFSAGLTALSVAGAAGTAAMVALFAGLSSLIPTAMKALGLGVVAFAEVIGSSGPVLAHALIALLLSLVTEISNAAPKINAALNKMLLSLLRTAVQYTPSLIDAGSKLLIALLKGFAKNITGVAKAATDVIVKFLDALGKNLPRIIDAGYKMIVNFVNGLAKAIRDNSAAMGAAGGNLASAIVEGMVTGLRAGVGKIVEQAKNLARSALDAAKNLLGIHSPSKEFEKIGKFVVKGFVIGLTGSRDEIVQSFNYLKGILRDAITSSNEDVKQAEERLKRLTAARHKDNAAIREAKKELAQARKEHAATSAAFAELTKNLADERDKLRNLAGQYDKVAARLKNAKQTLADAKKTRDDYNKSIKDQYSNLPDITGETKLTDYFDGLRKQIQDTQTFATAIQKLRDLGLNDVAYKELLTKGISTLPFVQELLAGGKDQVDALNKLDGQLTDAAGGLGKSASAELYQAAVDAAAGLVKGLEQQQKAIEKQMEKIADAMVAAIKKKLGIKSPSTKFAEVGSWSVEGLAKGLRLSSASAEKAAENVGRDAILAMQKTLSGMSELVSDQVDVQPTITPVLDLSGVRKSAAKLDDILATAPLALANTYSKAQTNALAHEATLVAADTPPQPVLQQRDITFIQNNNSPKALSAAELYRQTNNQISVARGALAPK